MMRKKFDKHTTRCDYNEKEVEAYFDALMLIKIQGESVPSIERVKTEVTNILGYTPDNFVKYMIQMKTRECFRDGI